MNKKYKSIILAFIILMLIISNLYFMFDHNRKNQNDSLNGTYAIKSNNVILSLDIQEKTYHYYDYQHQISELSQANGTFKTLDEDTVIFETGALKKTIVLIYDDGIKLIDQLDSLEKSKTIVFEKIDDSETIMNQ